MGMPYPPFLLSPLPPPTTKPGKHEPLFHFSASCLFSICLQLSLSDELGSPLHTSGNCGLSSLGSHSVMPNEWKNLENPSFGQQCSLLNSAQWPGTVVEVRSVALFCCPSPMSLFAPPPPQETEAQEKLEQTFMCL